MATGNWSDFLYGVAVAQEGLAQNHKHLRAVSGEIEWMQTGRFRMGSSSSGFSSTDSLKILLPSSPP
jgi:hypothetical protein